MICSVWFAQTSTVLMGLQFIFTSPFLGAVRHQKFSFQAGATCQAQAVGKRQEEKGCHRYYSGQVCRVTVGVLPKRQTRSHHYSFCVCKSINTTSGGRRYFVLEEGEVGQTIISAQAERYIRRKTPAALASTCVLCFLTMIQFPTPRKA